MGSGTSGTDEAAELRQRAEALATSLESQEKPIGLSPEETRRMLHELRVHQIELEIQNEELRRFQIELETAQARYFDLYDLAPVGYYTLSEQGLIFEANLTAATMLGVGRGALLNQPISRFILKEDQDIYYLMRKRAFETGTRQMCELRMAKAEGAPFWTLSEATLASGANGTPVIRVVMSDLTERKRAENERAKFEVQLVQAQKMEAIGTLAGGIAHDFSNILQGIMGALSLVDLSAARGAVQELEEAKALVVRGADLTKQLLGFARRGKYDVRPVDLARVVERTSAIFARTHRHLEIQLDLAPSVPAVLMDHAQLEQILLNLFVNAAQAMPSGGRLHLRAEGVKLSGEEVEVGCVPGRYAKLAVQDTGTGMDAATQARIFEPFFTTKTPGHGTGLGLSSVYGILKSHAAFIRVESELGRGATFTLFLPATDQPVVTVRASPAPIQRGKGTILVVDDEPAVLRVNTRLLEKLGYDVLAAPGGKRAVELMRQHSEKISVVILDMIMPDMSGRMTYDALREIAPNLKVLLCSGYSLEGEAQENIASGCKGFLQKPFDAAALSAKLQEIM